MLGWTVEPGEHSTVVHVSGEIDIATQPDFEEAMRTGMRSGALVVIVDLDKVTFMSSVGLRVLLQVHADAQQAGRSVRVAGMSPIVRRIIDVTGLGQVLAVYPSIEEAETR
ncbi:STAS domain-containing protein [Actinocrispum sp. NPDC049592]|uniref:STAS domain-containing protein n=1 Tax=Actinocrispum sp. NPDC049592 TaxID=3154835 RepID=UPI00342C2948